MNQQPNILLTSSWTLFLKIVVPTIWTVFFGAFTIAFMFTDGARLFGFSQQVSIITVASFFLIGFTLLFFSLMGLKRIEVKEDSLIVSNYFKTYRIPFSNVSKVKVEDYALIKLGRIEFGQPVSFGAKIYGLINEGRLQQAVNVSAALRGSLEGDN